MRKQWRLLVLPLLVLPWLFACSMQPSSRPVIFQGWDQARQHQLFAIAGADADSYQTLTGALYSKDKNAAYFRGDRIVGADPASFTVLSETYAKDRSHAYFDGVVITAADAASFVITDDTSARDRNVVYSFGHAIHVCDPASFRWLKHDWQVDSKCAYHSTAILPGADAKTFEVINFWYAKDRRHVYTSLNTTLFGADAAHFRPINGCDSCGRDKTTCYNIDQAMECK